MNYDNIGEILGKEIYDQLKAKEDIIKNMDPSEVSEYIWKEICKILVNFISTHLKTSINLTNSGLQTYLLNGTPTETTPPLVEKKLNVIWEE